MCFVKAAPEINNIIEEAPESVKESLVIAGGFLRASLRGLASQDLRFYLSRVTCGKGSGGDKVVSQHLHTTRRCGATGNSWLDNIKPTA